MRPIGLFAAALALVMASAIGPAIRPRPALALPCIDGDNDGWCVPADCDDDDSSTNPGMEEECDPLSGADRDCDGAHGLEDCDCGGIDGDEDGDGAQCGGDSPDCDDHDASRFPDNPEGCFNGIDDDCDGQVDSADPDCAVDADGDGFAVPGDCDDTNAGVNPGMAEDCTNGIDDDCDGVTDDGDADCDADGDGYALDVDCDDGDPAAHPGAIEVANGHDDDCNGAVDEVSGGQLLADGGEITVSILEDLWGSFANDIYLFSPGPPRLLGTAGMATGPLSLGTFEAGTELVFGIIAHDGPDAESHRFYTGPGCRNFDGTEHAYVMDLGDGGTRLAFEDLAFGGDLSFDNAGLDVTGATIIGPTGGVPERCNGIDDDCEDGVDNDPLGTGAGCQNGGSGCTGTTVCVGGMLVCGVPDADGDGTPDCTDACPGDPGKAGPGACGCGFADTDADGDAAPDCIDGCPADPVKVSPGSCGCGVSDADSDGDGTPDCHDPCPADAGKVAPGVCGCGVADADSDGDGTADCLDACPGDATKVTRGLCGCGAADRDADADGIPDCFDQGQDLALTRLDAPKTVRLSTRRPAPAKRVRVWLQNRGRASEVVRDLPTLGGLVRLTVEAPPGCTALVALRPASGFPITVESKRKLAVSFDVKFACARSVTTARSARRREVRYQALVDRTVLDGLPDTHAADDVCPRTMPPAAVDPNPDGSIRDPGCGGRKPGAEILTRLVVR